MATFEKEVAHIPAQVVEVPQPSIEQKEATQQRVARYVSVVLHPFLIATLAIVMVLYLDTGNLWAALGWAGLCALFVVAPASLYLWRKLKRRELSDADVSVRAERHSFYLFGGVCMAVCFGALLWMGAPGALIAFFTAGMIAVVVSAAVTKIYAKVSVHSGVMAGAVVAAAFYSVPLAVLLALGAVVLAWARLTLERHTVSEIGLGWAIALVAVAGTFAVLPL